MLSNEFSRYVFRVHKLNVVVQILEQKQGGTMLKKKYPILTLLVVLVLAVSTIVPVLAVDHLRSHDFKQESWSKVIDYLEYVDVYAASHGLPRPPAGAHAYLYMNYVNHSGVQMLYAGVSNITMGLGLFSVTLPIQTFMMHYKTQNQSRDVVTASSYIMLLAYNETQGTIHTNSPDKNDTLYASFSMGFDLSQLISMDTPALNSKTRIIPLTHPNDNTWHWGMTYTNLTAIWWRVYIDPENPSYKSVPVAISVYEELTFTYDLIFNPDNNTAVITSNYVIGRMTDLWVVRRSLPLILHYNSTACYRLNKQKYSTETIHQYLQKNGISMSIVLFQASAILDHTTENRVNGQSASDNEVFVSNNAISTFSEDGEKIFDVDFSVKNTYNLYNYTSGSRTTYNAVPRTARKNGFARNPIFHIHTFLMKYIPLALAHMDKALYEQAKNQLLNMTYADYFYVISYPTYDGYRVEHDPTFIAYSAIAEDAALNPFAGLFKLVFIAVVVIIVAVAVVLILRRSRKSQTPL